MSILVIYLLVVSILVVNVLVISTLHVTTHILAVTIPIKNVLANGVYEDIILQTVSRQVLYS